MRVYELAKEYDYKATAFVNIIQSFDIDVKSHMSGLNEDQVKIIREKMDTVDHTKEGKVEEELSSLNAEELTPQSIFDGVKVDEQLNPVDEMEDGEETIEERNERREKEVAEENERVLAREKEYRERVIAKTQKVIVEKPTGFWSWLKGFFG